jgi:membrane fusion protein (multidrug efflux system)
LAEQALMRLDDSVERRKLDEATAALDAIGLRRQALHAQLNAEGRVRESQLRSSREALTRAELSVSEATTQVDYHERIGRVAAELHREELISHLDAFKSAQELLASQLHRDAVNADLFKQRADNHYTQQLQAARMVALSRELAELDAAEALAVATVNTARAQIEWRVVRAPVAGRIGSVAPLEIGDVVREGEPIATIVPDERLRVVAEFDAADALGRIRPGHVARVRLAGFSIVEFGTLAATVQQVASEAQRGRVRVELALATHLSTDLPLEHGVPGSVEVRVESTAPWRMLLRGMLPSSAGTRSASAEQPPATAAEYSGGAG